MIIVPFLCLPNQGGKSTDSWSKQTPIMSAPPKIPHSWCKLTRPPRATAKSCRNWAVARAEHLLTCCSVRRSPVSCVTHVWRSTWSGCCPAGPVSCPAPPGPLPACGSERCWSAPSPPRTRARRPTWLWKSGNDRLWGLEFYWVLDIRNDSFLRELRG